MANGYRAGDLNLSIQTIANDTLKSLDAVIERLNFINNGLTKISGITSSANRSRKRTNGNEKKYVTDASGKRYLALEKTVTSAGKAIQKTTKKFNSQNEQISKTITTIDEYGDKLTEVFNYKNNNYKNNNYKNKKNSLLDLGKWTAVLYIGRKIGRVVANIVKAGSDYTETLNLWQVAMRDNLDMAEAFVDKMNKAYGVSSKNLMNAQAIFKNMIGSLGQITDETAYKISEALVKMSIDFSSLYNVKLESAFEKMQSMLAGQVRPIRSAGLDMTETTLYQFYQELGGEKTMRQLNRTEKQLLSILAVYKQMGSAGALGDMSKTLNSFANQSRMLTEYWSELKTWSGLILKDIIDSSGILIYINALLITVTTVLKSIAKSKGLGEENFIEGLFETTENTNEEVEKLQSKLLGFDKFRSLNNEEDDDTLAIDEKLLEAITDYDSKVQTANNAAQQLADEWLKILGYEKKSNGNLDITAENLENLTGNLALFGVGLATIFAFLPFGSGSKTKVIDIIEDTATGALSLGKAMKDSAGKATLLSTALGFFKAHPAVAGILSIVGVLALFASQNDDVRESLEKLFLAFEPLLDILGDLISGVLSTVNGLLGILIDLLAPIIDWLVRDLTYGISMVVIALTPVLYILESIIKMCETILVLLQSLFSFDFKGLGSKLKNIWTNWDSTDYAIESADLLKTNWNNLWNKNSLPDTKEVNLEKQTTNNTVSNYNTYNANQQNAQTTYQATMSALNDWWSTAKKDLPQFQEANATGMYQVVTGVAKSYGNKWDTY